MTIMVKPNDLQLFDQFLQLTLIHKVSFSDHVNGVQLRATSRRHLFKLSTIGCVYCIFKQSISIFNRNRVIDWIIGNPSYLVNDMLMVNTCILFCILFGVLSLSAYRLNEYRRTNHWVEPLATIIENPRNLMDILELSQHQLEKLLFVIKYFPLFKLASICTYVAAVIYLLTFAIYGCFFEGQVCVCLSFIVNSFLFALALYPVSLTYSLPMIIIRD